MSRGFVDGCHLHFGGERVEHFVDFLGTLAVALGMSVDEDGMRAHLSRGTQRHGGVNSELARFVGGGGDNTTLVALAANDDGLAFQRRVEELFDRDEEGVHVDVEDGTGKRGIGYGGHAQADFSSGGRLAGIA
ncbi:MAG TPA: hypothetical protein VFE61_22890 [Candidatus Sulfotelmatobacter sp.]|nr:hypothetical protein [Candidatus Sulfotelmatobacter sp.]